MILTVGKRGYRVDAYGGGRCPDTAILIPANLRDPAACRLTRVALDAIMAFTPEPHTPWVIDTGREPWPWWPDWHGLCARSPHALLRVRTRIWPWYSTARRHGSLINGVALGLGLEYLFRHAAPMPRHVFVMHNDALPLRTGWLSYLRDYLRPASGSDPGLMISGVKASERNGAPHPSGALYDLPWLGLAGRGSAAMLPVRITKAPGIHEFWDAGEWPGSFRRHWTAAACAWRPAEGGIQWWTGPSDHPRIASTGQIPAWLVDTPADVSFDDDGRAFYLHRGGGSTMSLDAARAWTTLARQALGLRKETT